MKGFLVMEPTNWQVIMEAPKWTLEEAISYIKEQEPTYCYTDETGYPTEKQYAARVSIYPKYMNSRTAREYIKAHVGEGVYDGIYTLENSELKREEIYSEITVLPRDFLEWCEQEEIPIPNIYLSWYLDYTHWRHKDEWTFDEAYLILHSRKCPLPSEIFEVLENDDTYEPAREFYNLCHSKDIYEFGFMSPEKGDYLIIAKEAGVKFSKALEGIMSYELSKKKRREKERARKNKVDFENWLAMPLWTVHEALCLACNRNPTESTDDTQWFAEQEKYNQILNLFSRAHTLENFEFIEQHVRYDLLDGSLPPKAFVSWFVLSNIEIPDELKVFGDCLDVREVLESAYISPYMRLMVEAIKTLEISDDNQPIKKQIVSWLKAQTIEGVALSDREAEYLATFIRLPIYKKGGNRSVS